MKTSELKKILEKNGYMLEEGFVSFSINYKNRTVANITKKGSTLSMLDGIEFEVAQAILDYAYTPLEEREEEKKYYLKSKLKDRDLNEVFVTTGGIMHNNEMYLSPTSRNQFTQKEIDEMPFDTKFFEKVEVK